MSQLKFRKKPVEIQAMQFTGWGTFAELQKFAPGVFYVPAGAEHSLRRESERDPANGNFYDDRAPDYLVIPTLEGDMRADRGDWIISGVQGELLVGVSLVSVGSAPPRPIRALASHPRVPSPPLRRPSARAVPEPRTVGPSGTWAGLRHAGHEISWLHRVACNNVGVDGPCPNSGGSVF